MANDKTDTKLGRVRLLWSVRCDNTVHQIQTTTHKDHDSIHKGIQVRTRLFPQIYGYDDQRSTEIDAQVV